MKVVLITGATSGIGKSVGTYLTQKGMTVYGTGRKIQPTISSSFPLVELDVTDHKNVKEVVKKIISDEGQLDVLINNAGVGITGAIEETPMEEIKKVFETNLFGAIAVTKEVLPQMRIQKDGIIINITSIGGYMGLPFRGIYSATKGALELITETLRMETQQWGIRVISIAPGDIATSISKRRYHTPVNAQSPYAVAYQKNLDLMNAHVNKGLDPIIIAKKIYRIIRSKDSKNTYKIGRFLEKFSVFLKRVTPQKYFERKLMNHYKLTE